MLIVALIRRDERINGNGAGAEIGIQTVGAVKPNRVGQRAIGLVALLYASKVDERVVLHGIKINDVAGGQGRGERGFDRAEIRIVGEEAVADIYFIGASGRQALLIAFPGA